MSVAASLLLGALLGAANASASLLMARRSRGRDLNGVMKVVLGGGLVRLVLLLAAATAVLVLVPVRQGPFLIGLGVVYVAGLLTDVALVLGRPSDGAPASSRPPADA